MIRLISAFLGYTIILEACNGKELIEKLSPASAPDIVLLDITMPEMDGYQTALWLKQHYPRIKVLALSTYENEQAIIKILKSGAKGYILKVGFRRKSGRWEKSIFYALNRFTDGKQKDLY